MAYLLLEMIDFLTIGSAMYGTKSRFYFKDNGRGISGQATHKIFELFESITYLNDHNGIELSIFKSIIKIKNTLILVESEDKSGLIF